MDEVKKDNFQDVSAEDLAAVYGQIKEALDQALEQHPEYDNSPVFDGYRSIGLIGAGTINGHADPEAERIWDSILHEVLEIIQNKDEPEAPDKLTVRRVVEALRPSDQYTKSVFTENLFARDFAKDDGQYTFLLDVGNKGKGQIVSILNVDFSNVPETIAKKLGVFEKRVHNAVGSILKESGQTECVTTYTQIWFAMGGTSRPSKKQIEKIKKAIELLSSTRVNINNYDEAKAMGYKVYGNRYFNLLYTDVLTRDSVINGQTAEGFVKILSMPRLIEMAAVRGKGQIDKLPINVLQTPLDMTDASLLLEDYLQERILAMRHGTLDQKTIMLKAIYEKCSITTAKQKSRLVREKLPRLLDYYKQIEFIKDYTLDSERISIDVELFHSGKMRTAAKKRAATLKEKKKQTDSK